MGRDGWISCPFLFYDKEEHGRMCPGITHLLQFMNREHFSPVCISCSYTHDNSRVNDPAPGGGPQGRWELT